MRISTHQVIFSNSLGCTEPYPNQNLGNNIPRGVALGEWEGSKEGIGTPQGLFLISPFLNSCLANTAVGASMSSKVLIDGVPVPTLRPHSTL